MLVPATGTPSIVQVTVCAGLFVPATVAVKVWVLPCWTFAVGGNTLTEVTVGGGVDTVTVAVPHTKGLKSDVALTFIVPGGWFDATVKTPVSEMLVSANGAPSMVHVTPCPGLLVPTTVAEKFCVPPCSTVADDGVTFTAVTVGVAPDQVYVTLTLGTFL